jgi:imidazolonepropionase-like amidohydrolase
MAHYYGLEKERALSAVTSVPAEVLGLGWRIGYVKEGMLEDEWYE